MFSVAFRYVEDKTNAVRHYSSVEKCIFPHAKHSVRNVTCLFLLQTYGLQFTVML